MSEFILDGTAQSGWTFDGQLPANNPAPSFLPPGVKFETYPGRGAAWNNTPGLALTSGTVQATAIWLPTTATIKTLYVATGATAGATMTHWWLALLDPTGQVRAVTADQIAAAMPANTLLSVPTTATLSVPYTGLWYLAVMVAATTPPTLQSLTSNNTVNGFGTVLAGTSSAAQTTPPALYASLAVPTAGPSLFYGAVG